MSLPLNGTELLRAALGGSYGTVNGGDCRADMTHVMDRAATDSVVDLLRHALASRMDHAG